MMMLYNIHHEVRLAFQSCSRPGISKVRYRTFKTFPQLPAPDGGPSTNIKRSAPTEDAKDVAIPPGTAEASPLQRGHQEASRSNTTELVPRTPKPGALQRPRRSDLPARLLPKAHVSPELTLSPKERLQIEYETRRPPKAGKKPVFKERLLIYHGGLGYTNYIALLRVTTMFAAGFGLVIMAPAYYLYENAPWWTVPLIITASTAPFFLVKFLARPFVSWIYLILPPYARQSPKAALEYSSNLPQNAVLQICFMRSSALTGQVEAIIADLVPRRAKWPPTTFEWVGRRVQTGPWFRGNPTRFFVNQRSGTGKAQRDTVPGIWENVYRRIMRVEHGRQKGGPK